MTVVNPENEICRDWIWTSDLWTSEVLYLLHYQGSDNQQRIIFLLQNEEFIIKW